VYWDDQLDGDQCTAKIAFTNESNEELRKYMDSNIYYIDLGGQNIRQCSNEAIQALFTLTMKVPDNKVTPSKDINIVKM
jgi:hypothetical protein